VREEGSDKRGRGALGRWLRRLVVLAFILVVAVPVTILAVFALQARVRLGDLRPWHRVTLESEFHAGRSDTPATFADYMKLEERLFAEVRRRVLDDPAAADHYSLGRYNPASVPARLALDTPYNRSFELVPETIRGGVLLVHGLTDSPYSMRALAEIFRDQGFYVLSLRLPGHGTIPSGLVEVTWEDWYAAVVLAARHVAERAGPGNPLYVGGHSTGGALTTLYSVRSLEDASLPRPARLVLVSPAIGITPGAALTTLLNGLAFLPGLEKSRWLDVLPEYDPYKYNSFPVNAASQIYKLTRELRRALDEEATKGRLDGMPEVLAFQSLVDATVTTHEVVSGLFARLPAQGHALVLFDINRAEALQDLISPALVEDLERVRDAPALPFRLTWVGNASRDSTEVVAYTREAGTRETSRKDLGLRWPPGVLSLGHVALPFPEDDPVYGLTPRKADLRYPLGALTVRGEAGTLVVSLGSLARLRSNPFFSVIREQVLEAVAADRAGPGAGAQPAVETQPPAQAQPGATAPPKKPAPARP
jgi:alpha-beta hydrolase superfamily lysophospholipase